MGLRTVVSASPAYERAMRQCGLSRSPQTETDWHSTLEAYMQSEALRRDARQRGLRFVQLHHSEDRIVTAWGQVLASLFEEHTRTDLDTEHVPLPNSPEL